MTAESLSIPAARVPERRTHVWLREAVSIFWLIMAVIGFHSFIAKPFYIPSESMVPGLLVGDRLVVSKYPYGWSYVSPTVPNPVAVFRGVVLREPVEGWSVQFPFSKGRILGRVPERGDVVIATPPGKNEDYIKRVIGLPGDRFQMRNGTPIINGVPVRRRDMGYRDIPVDANQPCKDSDYPGARIRGGDGREVCHLPIVRETLPNGRSYDTVDLGYDWRVDDYGPIRIAPGRIFLMGDNRDRSADSRLPPANGGLGGAIPIENIGGRAELITFSFNGSGRLRGGRAGMSLRPVNGP